MELLKDSMDRVITLIRNYDAVFWAGSGLSLYAGYPSGKELCKKILESAESEEHYKLLQPFENSLMDLSNEFSQLYSREKLIKIIRDKFDIQPKCDPKVHKQLSKIPQINTIITTNYDHLFEIAYGGNITICTGTNFKKTMKGKVDLYKIHGDTSESDSIVITSKDYSQFYGKLNTLLWSKIKGILAEKSVVFIGYSLEDKNIQDVFEKIISQIDSSDKEFFIVTPTLYEHKLKSLNTICKTTHIPLTGEKFIKYIEEEIRRNIMLDATVKKIAIDEAYKICRENGITPTMSHLPFEDTTKVVVDKISLTPELFFRQMMCPSGKEFSLTSNPDTFEAVSNFLNDCDCRELVIPSKDAVVFSNINGINVPENQKINGKLPNIVKLEKQEIVEKLNLFFDKDKQLGCEAYIRGFWGNVKSRIIIELACMNIRIDKNSEVTSFNFSFRYPHTVNNAIVDLNRLQLWTNGNDMVFKNGYLKPTFVLSSIPQSDEIKMLTEFIDENILLYQKIRNIENNLNDKFIIEKELTDDDIKHISLASSSLSPQTVKYTGTFTLDGGKLTLERLKLYEERAYAIRAVIEYPEVLAEDCFELFGKYFVLGKRRVTIVEPYITNIREAENMIMNDKTVNIKIQSKRDEAILEFITD